MKICSVEDCTSSSRRFGGLCYRHYILTRIRVCPATSCWEWVGATCKDGYGLLSVRGRLTRAPRAAWELMVGPIPEGMIICHHCDNPPCINPDHLFVGSAADNAADKHRKGRQRCGQGERNGNVKLTSDQVLRVAMGSDRAADLARELGVSPNCISQIRLGKTWRHLTGVMS